MKEPIKKYYSEKYDVDIKPGMVIVFDDPGTNSAGARSCLHIGMVTELYRDEMTAAIEVIIKEPSGHDRSRILDHDLNIGKIWPYDWREAKYIHSKAWDEWKKNAKIP